MSIESIKQRLEKAYATDAEFSDRLNFGIRAPDDIRILLAVADGLKDLKIIYQKIKDRSLIGQRDLYKWYQDEADAIGSLFIALKALEEAP